MPPPGENDSLQVSVLQICVNKCGPVHEGVGEVAILAKVLNFRLGGLCAARQHRILSSILDLAMSWRVRAMLMSSALCSPQSQRRTPLP